MRDFNTIQKKLGNLNIDNKIYLLGTTGAGKTSLVQHILGTSKDSFPSTGQNRTTTVITEYVICKKSSSFKATIIFKNTLDISESIEDIVKEALINALKNKNEEENEEEIIQELEYDLEQSSDQKFNLKFLLEKELINKIAKKLYDIVIDNHNENIEEIFDDKGNITHIINNIIEFIFNEIKNTFNKNHNFNFNLFDDEILKINSIEDKRSFILKMKNLLGNKYGSISPLVEYCRIEGNLLSDKIKEDLGDFILIDGEGIGHSIKEITNELSTRHYDFFKYCNNIVLVENSTNPFNSGGKTAIESIYLNGYQDKLKLVFSKTDELNVSDLNSYFRSSIKNLKNALDESNIKFKIQNRDSFKLADLNKKTISDDDLKNIKNLIKKSSLELKDDKELNLNYDFNDFLIGINNEEFNELFQKLLLKEHWAVIKAFTKRMYNNELEYRHIKPVSIILKYVMIDVNKFLEKQELNNNINVVKQNFSNDLIKYIKKTFISDNKNLWEKAYNFNGYGSDFERKNFILNKITLDFIPNNSKLLINKNNFKEDLKKMLLKYGIKERKKAQKILINDINISQIYKKIDFSWKLDENINILIGKNGSGKSTILKLIDGYINQNEKILNKYDFPKVNLKIKKNYENFDYDIQNIGEDNLVSSDIKSILISTFDNFKDEPSLNEKLKKLILEFGSYQRNINLKISKETEELISISDSIRENIDKASTEDLIKYKNTLINIDKIKQQIKKPIFLLNELLNKYFKESNKSVDFNDSNSPLIINLNSKEIPIENLSSGEKQLLIIFLSIIILDNDPCILLLDEPEISLHVEWQTTFLNDILKINSNLQIILATHNPLIALNRDKNQISKIELKESKIEPYKMPSKYYDVSGILIDFFNLSSVIGDEMKSMIRKYTEYKLIEEDLEPTQIKEMNELKKIIESSNSGEIIYNKKYFEFLKFIKAEKDNIKENFNNLDDIDDDEFLIFLEKYKK
ncbi:AAA family ATPase [Aureivirga sp. CE67]|uniref:AAA family ATPase n=1 Tax=Aureivirga sp. CE67 TaxID=1788983 RepID=UPI0018C9CE6E|nr:AAA family ATPase [Aureivirga sp. CE67]